MEYWYRHNNFEIFHVEIYIDQDESIVWSLTLCDTSALAGDVWKSKADISGAKVKPKTKGRRPPLGSVSAS